MAPIDPSNPTFGFDQPTFDSQAFLNGIGLGTDTPFNASNGFNHHEIPPKLLKTFDECLASLPVNGLDEEFSFDQLISTTPTNYSAQPVTHNLPAHAPYSQVPYDPSIGIPYTPEDTDADKVRKWENLIAHANLANAGVQPSTPQSIQEEAVGQTPQSMDSPNSLFESPGSLSTKTSSAGASSVGIVATRRATPPTPSPCHAPMATMAPSNAAIPSTPSAFQAPMATMAPSNAAIPSTPSAFQTPIATMAPSNAAVPSTPSAFQAPVATIAPSNAAVPSAPSPFHAPVATMAPSNAAVPSAPSPFHAPVATIAPSNAAVQSTPSPFHAPVATIAPSNAAVQSTPSAFQAPVATIAPSNAATNVTAKAIPRTVNLPRALANPKGYAQHVSPFPPIATVNPLPDSVSHSRELEKARSRIQSLVKERDLYHRSLKKATTIDPKTGKTTIQTLEAQNMSLRRTNAKQARDLQKLKESAQQQRDEFAALGNKYNVLMMDLHKTKIELRELKGQ